MLGENIVGLPSDRVAHTADVIRVIQMLEDSGISCCFVGEYALIYYGAGRVPKDRKLCVSDERYDDAVALFKSRNDILTSVSASPVEDSLRLLHLFPRFNLIGTRDFWVVHPARYARISCKPSRIEYSLRGLPYPDLQNYVEALLDTQNGVDLEDLIDAADLSEQWGEENIDLNHNIDIEWARQQNAKQRQVHGKEIHSLREDSQPRRVLWERIVRNKVPRMGYKHSSATHATRWRRHGSRDPRSRQRDAI